MAAKTRAQLVSEVTYTVGNRTDLATEAIDWVKRAYAYITESYELPEALATSTVATVAGTRNYDLPADYFSVYTVRNTTEDNKLIQVSPTYYDSLATDRSDSPTHYAIFSNDIWLYPTPDAVETIQLRYRKQFAELSSDSTVHELPIAWEVVLVSLASSFGFRALNEIERASYYRNSALADANRIHKRIEWDLMDRNEAVRVLGGE